MVLSAANFATQAHCLVLFLRLLGLLPQHHGGPLARAGSGGHSVRCACTHTRLHYGAMQQTVACRGLQP